MPETIDKAGESEQGWPTFLVVSVCSPSPPKCDSQPSESQSTCVEIGAFPSSGLLISKARALFPVGNLIWTSHFVLPTLLTGTLSHLCTQMTALAISSLPRFHFHLSHDSNGVLSTMDSDHFLLDLGDCFFLLL